LEASRALSQACANLLVATGHAGKPNNGLIGVWERANSQGAWDLGLRPVDDLRTALGSASAVYIAAADPAGDDPALAEALRSSGFLVVQELFLTETAKLADVVLPAQAFVEREGTLTNGERRVQRFYPAVPERPQALPDFAITARLGERLGLALEGRHPLRVMERIAAEVPDYAGVTYRQLAEVVDQWPIVGRGDLYYGGTSYENSQGLGVQLQPAAQRGREASLGWLQPPEPVLPGENGLLAVPITRLYDRGITVVSTTFLHERIPAPYVAINPVSAAALGITHGALARMHLHGLVYEVTARIDENVPENVALVPRSLGIPISGPAPVGLESIQPVAA
jgi:NADH-quinone oxidoreductase subunit G